MRRAAKTLILLLLLAALPLRGYAGVLMAFCEANHGGAAAALEHAHDAGAEHHHDSDDSTPGPSHSASACSVCASCCASASLATGAKLAVTFSAPGTYRIPFFGGQVSGFVPDHLDRPPLPL